MLVEWICSASRGASADVLEVGHLCGAAVNAVMALLSLPGLAPGDGPTEGFGLRVPAWRLETKARRTPGASVRLEDGCRSRPER